MSSGVSSETRDLDCRSSESFSFLAVTIVYDGFFRVLWTTLSSRVTGCDGPSATVMKTAVPDVFEQRSAVSLMLTCPVLFTMRNVMDEEL